MSSDDTLDLSQVDPPVWRVMVKQTVYGPYTLGQMRSFILEGRLSINSSTADGDGGAFMPAGEQPGLTRVFRQHLNPKQPETEAAPANHVVILRETGDSRRAIISALNEIGRFAEIMPGIYLLNTATRTAKLREHLSRVAAPDDRILIVNTDSGRLAWLGLPAKTNAHIRAVWKQKDQGQD